MKKKPAKPANPRGDIWALQISAEQFPVRTYRDARPMEATRVKLDDMPGGRPRALTAAQVERATLLRHAGFTIARIARDVECNPKTLRDQFARDGTKPRDVSTSRDLPPTPTPVDDEMDAFLSNISTPSPPADISMTNAPAAGSRQNGWATIHAMREVLARRYPYPQPMTDDDHRDFDSPAEDTAPYRGNL